MEERLQVNVRLTQALLEALDQRRVDLLPGMGRIPTRSEVIRDILDANLMTKAVAGNSRKPRAKKS